MSSHWETTPFAAFLTPVRRKAIIDPEATYKMVTLPLYGKGARLRKECLGSELGTSKFEVRTGDLMISKIDARKGSNSLLPPELDGAIVTGDFLSYTVDESVILKRFFDIIVRSPVFAELCDTISAGSTNRVRLETSRFLDLTIGLPPLEEQQRIVDLIGSLDDAIDAADAVTASSSDAAIELRRVYFEGAKESVLVGDVYDVIVGKQLQSNSTNGEPAPYLRAGNIGNGFLDVSEMKTMLFTEAELSRLQLEPMDVVIVEGGNGYGKSAVWNGQVPGRVALQNHVLRLRTTTAGYTSNYAHQWARWCHEQGRFKSTGTGIPNLGVGKIRQMTMPVANDASAQGIELLVSADQATTVAASNADSLRATRSEILTVLLSGEHEIPESYDIYTAVQLEPAA